MYHVLCFPNAILMKFQRLSGVVSWDKIDLHFWNTETRERKSLSEYICCPITSERPYLREMRNCYRYGKEGGEDRIAKEKNRTETDAAENDQKTFFCGTPPTT